MSLAMPLEGMVLAAGLGKRMRPLTDAIPKPLIPVAGRTLVDRAIDRMEEAGVRKVVVNTSYRAEQIEAHLAQRRHPSIVFSRETSPLETGGGVAQALSHFGRTPFFVANGDVIWLNGREPALARLAAHWEDELDALLLLHPVAASCGYEGRGDFKSDAEGRLTRRAAAGDAPYVFAGVQLLHPRLFANCPRGAFSLNLLYDQAMRASPPRLKGLIHDGEWLHVGDPAGLALAEKRLTQG